jgi:uncharacterized protein with FMN-binding domain
MLEATTDRLDTSQAESRTMNTQRAKYPFAILTGLTLVGALAGCSTAADGDTGSSSDGGDTSATTAPDTADATTTGSYADGEYTESAEYQSPNGTEEVTVTVTLEGGVITAVEAVGDGDNPNSKRYQSEFADGIADVVVGKNIDDISVDKVAGSSLTSAGFNDAIDAIKADAAS